MKNENKQSSYAWNWVKSSFIAIVFFALILLQIFQADKTKRIEEELKYTKKSIIEKTLKLSETNIEIENIKNGVLINKIAEERLGMVMAGGEDYIVINK